MAVDSSYVKYRIFINNIKAIGVSSTTKKTPGEKRAPAGRFGGLGERGRRGRPEA
jgi:hypothetical protein